jgi:alpha,alpha-trehalase
VIAPSGIQEHGPLFEAVQLLRVFPDGKTFVDAELRLPADEIASRFAALQRATPPDHLREVLQAQLPEWFTLPSLRHGDPVRATNTDSYIRSTWTRLTRQALNPPSGSTLFALPHPYLVPGGRFSECFYWDSYFTALGLVCHGHLDLVQGIADNLVHLQTQVGLIPNGSRSYFGSRSQPPVLALLVRLLPHPVNYLDALIREHTFWMADDRTVIVDGVRLAHYWDGLNTPRTESYAEDVHTNGGSATPCDRFRNLRAGAESGWDFSSRWLDDPNDLSTIRCADVLPIDLNTLLLTLEQTIAALADRARRKKESSTYRQLSLRRAEVLRHRCFDPTAGWFCDLEASTLNRRPHLSLAGVLPLVSSVATDTQAAAVKRTLMEQFLAIGGLRSTLVETDQQWDGSNGWAPLQYWGAEAMDAHGFADEAMEIRTRWLATCDRGFETSGVLMEKYNVSQPGSAGTGGEYAVQEGFGWTNGVYVAFAEQVAQATQATVPI